MRTIHSVTYVSYLFYIHILLYVMMYTVHCTIEPTIESSIIHYTYLTSIAVYSIGKFIIQSYFLRYRCKKRILPWDLRRMWTNSFFVFRFHFFPSESKQCHQWTLNIYHMFLTFIVVWLSFRLFITENETIKKGWWVWQLNRRRALQDAIHSFWEKQRTVQVSRNSKKNFDCEYGTKINYLRLRRFCWSNELLLTIIIESI